MQSRVRNKTEREATLTAEAKTRRARSAAMRVRDLRADLMLAAEHGTLSDAEGFTILTRHLSANATLPAACALVAITREIEAETAARKDAEAAERIVPDCANAWAEPGLPSCSEVVLLGVEQRLADNLADKLATGPWPL
jgi:hypothetical protein